MQVVKLKPWDNFVNSCDTEKTLEEYSGALRLFMIRYKIGPNLEDKTLEESIPIMKDSCEELLKIPEQDLENTIIDWLVSMKHLSMNTITPRTSALQKFLKSNRIFLKWDYINGFKKSNKKLKRDEAYTKEHIEQILKFCDERIKCITLILASTGIRVGAFEDLRLKHLKPIDTPKGKVYEFTIYEGSKEEYITYCTPECASAIDIYKDSRKIAGEELTKESALIRKQFDRNDLQQVKNDCKPLNKSTIETLVTNLLIKSGIRQVNRNAPKVTGIIYKLTMVSENGSQVNV